MLNSELSYAFDQLIRERERCKRAYQPATLCRYTNQDKTPVPSHVSMKIWYYKLVRQWSNSPCTSSELRLATVQWDKWLQGEV